MSAQIKMEKSKSQNKIETAISEAICGVRIDSNTDTKTRTKGFNPLYFATFSKGGSKTPLLYKKMEPIAP